VVQSLCGLRLLGRGPLQGEFGWSEFAVGGVGLSLRQSSMITRASGSESKRQELSSSSRSGPLNDSTQAFCQGEPGSMKSEPALLIGTNHRRRA
jgi:hypothetical protein